MEICVAVPFLTLPSAALDHVLLHATLIPWFSCVRQSLQSVMSSGIQGGFWLLLEEAALLLPPLVSRLAQYLHSVRHTKTNALKRWVCLSDPYIYPLSLLQLDQVLKVISLLYSVVQTPSRRCIIDGQEMKVVDSFNLFLTVTSPSGVSGGVSPPCPLLNHPIAPHLSPVTVCLPSTGKFYHSCRECHFIVFRRHCEV